MRKGSLIAALLLAGCSAAPKLAGEWVQPIPGQTGVQGIVIEEGGAASSINMSTLLYESWEKKGERLILRGKSVGNGQTIEFADTVRIKELTKEKLVLAGNGYEEVYSRRPAATGIAGTDKKGVAKSAEDLVRPDEKILDKITGELNSDNREDRAIITQQTKKEAFVTDEDGNISDRNRRGILIAFNDGENYNTVVAVPDCFGAENEDGGVYSAPELSVKILNGNLRIGYGHGRYGWRQYIFRYRNSQFELIGYDESDNRGPVTERKVSVNFLTKKQQTLKNTNPDAEGGDEVFEESWQKIEIKDLVKLTDIRDFSDFVVGNYYTVK